MQQFLTQLGDAATSIGATPLTFTAGMALLAFGLAYSWFGRESVTIRLTVFAVLLCMILVFLWEVYAPPAPASSPSTVTRSEYVVDFQFEGYSRPQAEALRQKLQQKGWTIYGVDAASGFRPTIIKSSASANDNAARALRDDLQQSGTQAAPVRFSTDPKIKPTHLELWVGPP